ncbi:MAG: FAD:protein FMN transferase [Chloroflexota bacterium]
MSPDLDVPSGMCRASFPAMGTTVTLLLPVSAASGATRTVRALFAEWEGTLSRFLPESELSCLNRRAGHEVAVSDLLFHVVATAIAAACATGGLYDPTLLHQMTASGYDRSFEGLSPRMAPAAGTGVPGGGWQRVRLDRARRCITLPCGAGLDLGGIAKGMAVDAALARLRHLGVGTALLDAGGDLAVLGLPRDAAGWPIVVPGRGAEWTVVLHHGAMATSGRARRHWRQGEQERHHLIDPRSGLPAHNGMWSVTTVAARCRDAEVAAKVAFVLGPTAGNAFLRRHGLAAIMVQQSGAWQAVGPWPVPADAV